MIRSQKGFTLIELVMIIVILGILAAVAIPRFVDLSADARIASVNGVAGNIRGAVSLARARYLVTGNMAAVSVTMDGTAVTVNAGTGIPVGTAAGIGAALTSTAGLTVDYTAPAAVTFRPTGGGATCQAVYNGTTGAVTTDTTGC